MVMQPAVKRTGDMLGCARVSNCRPRRRCPLGRRGRSCCAGYPRSDALGFGQRLGCHQGNRRSLAARAHAASRSAMKGDKSGNMCHGPDCHPAPMQRNPLPSSLLNCWYLWTVHCSFPVRCCQCHSRDDASVVIVQGSASAAGQADASRGSAFACPENSLRRIWHWRDDQHPLTSRQVVKRPMPGFPAVSLLKPMPKWTAI